MCKSGKATGSIVRCSDGYDYEIKDVSKYDKVLQLVGVDWQVQGTALVDDLLVPSSYKAVAQYSAKASYSAATGYISTVFLTIDRTGSAAP